MRRKKNGFFTFIWSFIPGAAEMYNGFMKGGLSLMMVFAASIIIPSVLYISDVFMLVPILVWFYAFFHARNMAACTAEEISQMEDDFIWDSFGDGTKTKIASPTLRRWGAAVLIVIGASLLWNNFSGFLMNLVPEQYLYFVGSMLDSIPQFAFAILIIAVGVALIVGKKKENKDE